MPPHARTVISGTLALALGVTVLWYARGAFTLSRGEYGEGCLLAVVERWRTEPVSARWEEGDRLTLLVYGPGYLWAVKVLSPWTPWDHTVIPGRLIALAALLATGALLARVVHRETGCKVLAQAAALLYLASPAAVVWVPYARVDTLAVLFSVAALASLGPRRRDLLLSALLIAVGSLVKQTVALSALPIALHLWLNGRRRDALEYSAGVALLGLLAWGALGLVGEGYFLRSATLNNLHPFVWEAAVWKWRWFLGGWLTVATLLVLGHLILYRPTQFRRSPITLALVVNLVLSLVLVAKEGANLNYFLEASALAALVVTLDGFRWLQQTRPRLQAAVQLGVACSLALQPTTRAGGERRQPTRVPLQAGESVLADGECLQAVIRSGGCLAVNDPYQFRQMAEYGDLSPVGVIRALEDGSITRLVLSCPLEIHTEQARSQHEYRKWPTGVLVAMKQNFSLQGRAGGGFVYSRRDAPPFSPGAVEALVRRSALMKSRP